jgi:polysaccharide export outer membrane protein
VHRKSLMCLGLSAYLAGCVVLDARAQGPARPISAAVPKVTSGNGIEDDSHQSLQQRNWRYQLHSADVLELNFPFSPEFNQTVTVQPDGYISLRGTESIRVQGQTLPEVSSSVRAAYASILRDPVIQVELKDFEKPYFIVGGEVGHPGKFELRGETTTTEGVAIAGGMKDSASSGKVWLFHRVPDGWVQGRRLNMKKMLKDGRLNEDAYLQPGDFLYVPKNHMSGLFARFIPTSSLGLYASPLIH